MKQHCPHCGGSLYISRELDSHEIRCLSCSRRPDEPFHQVTSPQFSCVETFCRGRFTSEADLTWHHRQNHEAKNYNPHRTTPADKLRHHGVLSAPANNTVYRKEFEP